MVAQEPPPAVESSFEHETKPLASVVKAPPLSLVVQFKADKRKLPDTERVVEVALVVVAFRAVKFWRVVEPVAVIFWTLKFVLVALVLVELMDDKPPVKVVEAVQRLALARLRVAVRVPPRDTGEPPRVRLEFESVTVMEEF